MDKQSEISTLWATRDKHLKQAIFAAGAFLAAWQATDFSLDYRAILGALTAATLGAMNPNKTGRTK